MRRRHCHGTAAAPKGSDESRPAVTGGGRAPGERGQAAILVLGGLCGLLIGAFVLGAVARGIGKRSEAQRAADLAALAGARAMLDSYPRLFEPPTIGSRRPNPFHLDRAAYLRLGSSAAMEAAQRNGAEQIHVAFPDAASPAPVRIEVTVRRRFVVRSGRHRAATSIAASAQAELAPGATSVGPGAAGGEYAGPFAIRQGQRMRPDVASAFDRMQAAARADGVRLMIASAFRSDAEQAVLFARHPDPRWVARPGESLHRYGTELDLGPPAAYHWLAAQAARFHFVQRYAWEPWHWGYGLNARSRPSRADGASSGGSAGHGAVPAFVPRAYAPAIIDAAQRWNVSATLLSAQLHQESNFNPFAVSGAGARGIAQFMPGTAAELGLSDPTDPEAAIDAQAHLMRDLLRRFASVPLALAAYNAGAARVQACMCIPPLPETRGYVAGVLGLMAGAGDMTAGGLAVRLVS